MTTSTTTTTASAAAAAATTTPWRPNPELMTQLTDMGISAVAAKKALYYTDNQSIELATNWIFDGNRSGTHDLDTPLELELGVETVVTPTATTTTASSAAAAAGSRGGIGIRGEPVGAPSAADSDSRTATTIGSGGGGVGGGGGGQEVYKMVFIVNSSLQMGVGKIAAQVAHAALGMHGLLLQDEPKFGVSLIRWSEFGETKIVLKGESTQHLVELEKRALSSGLPTYLVQDAGKTQVNAGSTTVLCLYGSTDTVDSVSGDLRLL
ncbi:peptidyl-tRNA hydrolase 2, mitochondrial-like [Oppia nitens]|uniref:peptidyl-tRNA hydrolase 2, mitochondrial-like n=1 Tax=Oppia nitens TaxID=1686743 RepID=UPI0023DC745D|nr:peptidyl-tRNA hydrolase 2, mitochondrial-like [Oppia nitens]